MNLFINVLEHGNLHDLGWMGEKFTWSNMHEDETYTKERLDRVLSNQSWLDGNGNYKVDSFVAICSDHRPLMLDCGLNELEPRRGIPSSFHYELNWGREEGCTSLVATKWKKGIARRELLESVQAKLETCGKGLRKWSKNLDRERTKAIKDKSTLLAQLQENEVPSSLAVLKQLHKDIDFLLDQEDIKWKQRAKRHWIEKGDRSTKFYHACVNQRMKKNYIKKIMTADGVVLTDFEEIMHGFWQHLSQVFLSTYPTGACINECIDGMNSRISEAMRCDLEKGVY